VTISQLKCQMNIVRTYVIAPIRFLWIHSLMAGYIKQNHQIIVYISHFQLYYWRSDQSLTLWIDYLNLSINFQYHLKPQTLSTTSQSNWRILSANSILVHLITIFSISQLNHQIVKSLQWILEILWLKNHSKWS
jgi:hypothetical protein